MATSEHLPHSLPCEHNPHTLTYTHPTPHTHTPSQHILRDIAENGLDSPSPQYQLQRNFLTSIMKGLSNKQLSEAATICCIDHFKAGSFVKERSQSFFRFFISQIQGKLHVSPPPTAQLPVTMLRVCITQLTD